MRELIAKIREMKGVIRATKYGLAVPGKSVAQRGITIATLQPLCPAGWELSEAKELLPGESHKAIYVTKSATDSELLEHCKSL